MLLPLPPSAALPGSQCSTCTGDCAAPPAAASSAASSGWRASRGLAPGRPAPAGGRCRKALQSATCRVGAVSAARSRGQRAPHCPANVASNSLLSPPAAGAALEPLQLLALLLHLSAAWWEAWQMSGFCSCMDECVLGRWWRRRRRPGAGAWLTRGGSSCLPARHTRSIPSVQASPRGAGGQSTLLPPSQRTCRPAEVGGNRGSTLPTTLGMQNSEVAPQSPKPSMQWQQEALHRMFGCPCTLRRIVEPVSAPRSLPLAPPLRSLRTGSAAPFRFPAASPMSAVAVWSAPATLATHSQQQRGGRRQSGGSGGGGTPMLRAALSSARGRLLSRAAAFSASMLQPHAGARDASKVTAAAAARAARAEAAPVGDAASDAKVGGAAGSWRSGAGLLARPLGACWGGWCSNCPGASIAAAGARPPLAPPSAGARPGQRAERNQLPVRQEQHHEAGHQQLRRSVSAAAGATGAGGHAACQTRAAGGGAPPAWSPAPLGAAQLQYAEQPCATVARALPPSLRFRLDLSFENSATCRWRRVTSSSGALTLDLALGGGYPKGRVVEIYGPGALRIRHSD